MLRYPIIYNYNGKNLKDKMLIVTKNVFLILSNSEASALEFLENLEEIILCY